MPIPESQLETWSHQGAVATSSTTYASIQTALSATTSPVRGKDYEVFLQGSYKNDTNIRGDSDVDVVVQLNETFYRDLSALPADQKRLYENSHGPPTYHWLDFRRDVLQALHSYYGTNTVTEGDKSLKLSPRSGRLGADVVPAAHFRKYKYFYSWSNESYIEGIRFFTRQNSHEITNFPKPHYYNGVKKHSPNRTNGWFKPTVRIFKNARTYLVDHGSLTDDVAPSYFVECLIYNAPDTCFGPTWQETFAKVWTWLAQEALANGLRCQNEELPLFGSSAQQWSLPRAQQLLIALRTLWEGW